MISSAAERGLRQLVVGRVESSLAEHVAMKIICGQPPRPCSLEGLSSSHPSKGVSHTYTPNAEGGGERGGRPTAPARACRGIDFLTPINIFQRIQG